MHTNVVCRLVFLSTLLLGSVASAQTGAPINPISYFQVQEGSTAVSWSQTSTSVDSSGNSIINFQDGNGGTSTMTWSSTGVLSNWSINLGSGFTQVFTDAIGQGCPGSFTLTAGAFGNNPVLSINGHAYVVKGSLLQPTQNSYSRNLTPVPLAQFTVAATAYNYVSVGTDYTGQVAGTFANGTKTYVVTENQGFQVYGADGTCADYLVDPSGRTYTYQESSTAANQLSKLNGESLTVSGDTLSFPVPIMSFVVNGVTYTLATVALSASSGVYCQYTNSNGPVYASTNPNGSLNNLRVLSGQSSMYIVPGNSPLTFQEAGPAGSFVFTAFNGIPYVLQGSVLVPQGPVSGFTFGGSTYQFTGYLQAGDGNWIAQYQTSGANPVNATAEYSPNTDALVKLTVNAPGGGTAVYVDGASVGQPGAYVWSSTSTATNQLSALNGNSYNPAGDSDLPSTATTSSGVFKISGNFMSLGSWFNNPNQSGFDLAYYDGQTSAPSSVEFTGSRPLTAWVWDAATADGTAVTPIMQVDESSRLLLYPAASAGTTNPAGGPTPAVILDPSTTIPATLRGSFGLKDQYGFHNRATCPWESSRRMDSRHGQRSDQLVTRTE